MTVSIQYHHKWLSEVVGSSTLRGHPKGTEMCAREYLRASVDLEEFRGTTPESFLALLDKHTLALAAAIRAKVGMDACYWGSARKCLNLFLEQASYHYVLRPYYGLDQIEQLFEVPLDSHVAKGLYAANVEEGAKIALEYRTARNAGQQPPSPKYPKTLSEWTTIKDLLPKVSQAYQDYALEYARSLDCLRVHLDLVFWRASVPKA